MIDIENPNITIAKYSIAVGDTEPSCVVIIHEGVVRSVPMNEENADYQTILQLVENGDLTIQEADANE